MKNKLNYLLGALLVASLILSDCGKQTASPHSNNSSQSTKVVHRQANRLWNPSKDQKLKNFIQQWAPTMNQKYTKYDGHHQLKTNPGSVYPRDFSKTTVNGQHNAIGWAPTGKGKYDYNVVAIYNYNHSDSPEGHITYAFAFHHGEPVALVDQSTNGTPDWTQTKNTDVQNNFFRIAKGQKASFSLTKQANHNNSSEGMSFEQAAALIQKGGFKDFDYDNAKMTHDGSHPTNNGGYFMVTYPGAKGQDHFTITKTGKGKYHIEAQYGSSDNGFTLLPDQKSYGPTSADVNE